LVEVSDRPGKVSGTNLSAKKGPVEPVLRNLAHDFDLVMALQNALENGSLQAKDRGSNTLFTSPEMSRAALRDSPNGRFRPHRILQSPSHFSDFLAAKPNGLFQFKNRQEKPCFNPIISRLANTAMLRKIRAVEGTS
jgi:hypothetical protein